jgi:hypothetical protein
MPDHYSRELSNMDTLQSVTRTKPSQFRTVPLLGIGDTVSYSVQTFRQDGDIIEEDPEKGTIRRGPAKFTAFLEVGRGTTLTRIVLPDNVLALILRQRDALTTSALRRTAKQAAATRKARGYKSVPPPRRKTK